jgi:pimeloyl-ACP methyl ester carboxylesterase
VIAEDQRELFDMIAPLTTARRQDEARVLDLAEKVADTALALDPLLDPGPFLSRVRVPILFTHGRDDRLIPFTESMRLARAVPADKSLGLTITSLFQHSGGTQTGLGPIGLAREGVRFVHLLHRVLTSV